MTKSKKEPPKRAAYGIDEFSGMLGISRASTFKAIKAGDIKTVKVCGRRLVPAEELKRLLETGAE